MSRTITAIVVGEIERDVVAVARNDALCGAEARGHGPSRRIVAEVARERGANLYRQDRALLDRLPGPDRVVALLPDRPLHLVDSGGDLPQLGRTLRCELGVLTSTDAAYGGGDRRQGDHQPAADEERRDRGHDERHPDRQHEGPRRGDPARVDRRPDVLEPRVDRAVELVEAVADDVEASLRSPGLDERIGQLRVARANGIDFAFRFAAPLCDCLLYSRERKWVTTAGLDRLELR